MSRAGRVPDRDRRLPATHGFRRVIVGVDHPYIAGGLAMDATGIGTGHNDSFVYQARAFLDEVAGLRRAPPQRLVRRRPAQPPGPEEAVVRAATQNHRRRVTVA